MKPPTVTTHLGDCLEVLRTLPDASVHACVTDPPYELSNDGKASPARVLSEVMLPQDAEIPAIAARPCALLDLAVKIAGLRWPDAFPRPASTVPVSAVDLDEQVADGEKQIEYSKECAVGIADGELRRSGDTEGPEYLGCFALQGTDRKALIAAFSRTGTGFCAGGFGIGLWVGSAGLPSLFGGCGSVVVGGNDIGPLNDALALAIGAGPRTEDEAMPRLDMAGGAPEGLPAVAALQLLGVFHLAGAKLVRAGSRAGSLPAVLQPHRICVIDGATNRALSFDLLTHAASIAGKGFMGKGWDGSKIAYDIDLWKEIYRVLKPGGHLLAFGGSRTSHRLTCAVEDAGFEIRDAIQWIYSTGFP